MHNVQNVKGSGPLTKFEQGKDTRLRKLSMQHILNFFENKLILYSGDKRAATLVLDSGHSVEGVVQDGHIAYVLTHVYGEGYGGFAESKYCLSEMRESDTFATSRPKVLETFRYSTSLQTRLVDMFFDGERNAPVVILNAPPATYGYNGHFVSAYTGVIAFDLKNLRPFSGKTILTNRGNGIERVVEGDKVLVSTTIQASAVPKILEQRKADPLRDVYLESDLELVQELNKERDLAHRKNCWRTSSCIDREMFDLMETVNYPTYEIAMDTTGKIYRAQRTIKKS